MGNFHRYTHQIQLNYLLWKYVTTILASKDLLMLFRELKR